MKKQYEDWKLYIRNFDHMGHYVTFIVPDFIVKKFDKSNSSIMMMHMAFEVIINGKLVKHRWAGHGEMTIDQRRILDHVVLARTASEKRYDDMRNRTASIR